MNQSNSSNMIPSRYLSVDDAQHAILAHLLTAGVTTSPRGLATIESRALSFTLLDPRRRCILNPARKWSLPLALGELCWHLSGSTQASALAYYAPAWRLFADSEGQIRGSCYGSKIFLSPDADSPWTRVRRLLETDRDTRRAVLYFNDALSHLAPDCGDAACATSLQFLIRAGALDAVVCMRSNDVIWGLPYDVFLFTFLQEMMAVELGVEIGYYHHFAASLHLYEKQRSLAVRVLECKSSGEFSMPPLENPQGVQAFLDAERRMRLDHKDFRDEGLGVFWKDLAQVLRLFDTSRKIGWPATLNATSNATSPQTPYFGVLKPLARGSDSLDFSLDLLHSRNAVSRAVP
jgi:thymidylate synthase